MWMTRYASRASRDCFYETPSALHARFSEQTTLNYSTTYSVWGGFRRGKMVNHKPYYW